MTLIDSYQNYFKELAINLDIDQQIVLKTIIEIHQEILIQQQNFIIKLIKKNKSIKQAVYLFGAVGRGKTLLMDALFNLLTIENKLRIHFHSFMLMIHSKLFELNKNSKRLIDNSILTVAKSLSKDYQLICLDELQISDVGDLMIFSQIIQQLLDLKTRIVITSNRPPQEIYQGIFQRQYFNQLVLLIEQKFIVHALNNNIDYRRQKNSLDQRLGYFLFNEIDIEQLIFSKTQSISPKRIHIDVNQRQIIFNRSYQNILVTSFDELCKTELGAADYLKIAGQFKIIFLLNLPKLAATDRNCAKRFTILIDILYEQKIQLFITAQVKIEELYLYGDGIFEFQRTISRLIEMQTSQYLDSN